MLSKRIVNYKIPGAKKRLYRVYSHHIYDGLNNILPYGWIFLCCISIAGIIILVLTDCRFDKYENVKCYNDIWLSICVGILSSCVFYFVNEVVPKRELNRTMKWLIEHDLNEIWELIRECVLTVIPKDSFSLDPPGKRVWVPKKSEYLKFFNSYNFYSQIINGKPAINFINEKIKEIKSMGLYLLNDYSRYLSIAQIHYLHTILTSPLILDGLNPMDFEVDEEYNEYYPNNQDKVGRSLYDLYKKRRPFNSNYKSN